MMCNPVQAVGKGEHSATEMSRLEAAAGKVLRVSAKRQKAMALILSRLVVVAKRIG